MSAAQEPRGEVVMHPAGKPGLLRTSDGRTVHVQTYERGEEVVLIPLTEVGQPLPEQTLDLATLEYKSQRGIVRMRGDAEVDDRSLVRFHVSSEPEVVQRRSHVRVHTPQPVVIEAGLSEERLLTYTIDVSGGGMLLSEAPRMQIGDPINFEIKLGEGHASVCGTARRVRDEPRGRAAFSFEEIAERDRQRLIRFVFERLRNARAKTRGDID